MRFLLLFLLLTPVLAQDRVAELRSCLSPLPVLSQADGQYHSVKALSYRNNLASPLAIIQASSEEHVKNAVKCAKKSSITVCARSGGHSLIGHSLCAGLVIDLSNMRKVTMKTSKVALIQPGAVMGEVLWKLHEKKRWLAAGVCPSVGFAGYLLGGGHGPYEGTLGLACDSLISLRMVDRNGRVLKVSKKKRRDLFWAMCGAGGGQFGIVTQFKMKTADVGRYDRGVVWRFVWPKDKGGELIEKWQRYDEDKGKVWARIEAYLGSSDETVALYGACFDVKNVDECLNKLKKADFYHVPGRLMVYMSKANNALDLHTFFGPEGGWGKFRASNVHMGMLGQRGRSNGHANNRKYQSTFISGFPGRDFWQQWLQKCQANGPGGSVPWVVCEMNLFNNAIDKKSNSAFAHRKANLITHYIIGGGTEGDKNSVYGRMKGHMDRYTSGVYLNYPELELGKGYANAYWGSSLQRLQRIKRKYDPGNFFANPQTL